MTIIVTGFDAIVAASEHWPSIVDRATFPRPFFDTWLALHRYRARICQILSWSAGRGCRRFSGKSCRSAPCGYSVNCGVLTCESCTAHRTGSSASCYGVATIKGPTSYVTSASAAYGAAVTIRSTVTITWSIMARLKRHSASSSSESCCWWAFADGMTAVAVLMMMISDTTMVGWEVASFGHRAKQLKACRRAGSWVDIAAEGLASYRLRCSCLVVVANDVGFTTFVNPF